MMPGSSPASFKDLRPLFFLTGSVAVTAPGVTGGGWDATDGTDAVSGGAGIAGVTGSRTCSPDCISPFALGCITVTFDGACGCVESSDEKRSSCCIIAETIWQISVISFTDNKNYCTQTCNSMLQITKSTPFFLFLPLSFFGFNQKTGYRSGQFLTCGQILRATGH